VIDPRQTDDRVHKGGLLWAAVHSIGVGNLNGAGISVIVWDGLSSFGGLLAVGCREGFGLGVANVRELHTS
jgi:hypothetical protein